MKKISTLLFAALFSSSLFAQDIRLNDSVIFINNQPVAFYGKTLNNTPLRYNVEVYNSEDYVLIKAEAIKFTSPLRDPEPFYYYEISFPPLADTFSIYVEGEAFPLVLGQIIKDYNLITNNQLNADGVNQFKSTYYGGAALTAKIKIFTDKLNLSLHVDEQVVRDRAKPVSLKQNKILQDGKIIGFINIYKDNKLTSERQYVGQTIDSTRSGGAVYSRPVYETVESQNPYDILEITLTNGRKIDVEMVNRNGTHEVGLKARKLWEMSESTYRKNKKPGLPVAATRQICFLVEANAL